MISSFVYVLYGDMKELLFDWLGLVLAANEFCKLVCVRPHE